MKRSFQLNPIPGIALAGSLAWFALWLTAFQPAPQSPVTIAEPPPAVLCQPTEQSLQVPTLFALPSAKGFSGDFPADLVAVNLSLERLPHPETYLPHQPEAAPQPDQTQLIKSVRFPKYTLPAPGALVTTTRRHPAPIALFLSPKLQSRARENQLPADLQPLPVDSLRIYLTVQPDGHIAHAFFDAPMEHPEFLRFAYSLRFHPTPNTTWGWIDLRFSTGQTAAKGVHE